jgi:hypothetical protein
MPLDGVGRVVASEKGLEEGVEGGGVLVGEEAERAGAQAVAGAVGRRAGLALDRHGSRGEAAIAARGFGLVDGRAVGHR